MPPRSSSILAAVAVLALLGAGCDRGARAAPAEQGCLACHRAERERASFPDHVASGLPEDCSDCHSQQAWSPAAFDHSKLPLVGGHSTASCSACHEQEPPPNTCWGCHDEDRQRARDPDHRVDGFSTSCEECHTVNAWRPAAFNHGKLPFVGGHSGLSCNACHDREPVPTTCFGCHAADRARPTNPDHEVSGFPTRCEDCHTVYAWKAASFSHDRFQLIGRHATVPCASCHDKDPVPKHCAGCHEQDRAKPTQPNHLAAGFSTACDACHSVNGWTPAGDHAKFPLTGRHSVAACTACHANVPPQQPVPVICFECHDKDRSKPLLPSHLDASFPTTCEQCHTVNGWKPAAFDHNKLPLTGGHQGVACASCHTTTPVPSACGACHDADRAKPVTPDHLAPGFSTACDGCHTTAAWKPAATDHGKYPLTGSHAAAACTACHATVPPTAAVPTLCADCHQADRAAATAPDHTAAEYGVCQDCHDTNGWKGAAIDHTKYPLTGKHLLLTCAGCHSSSPVPTTCVGCHTKDRATPVTPDHLVASFSTDCTSCHSTDGWKPAAFDHGKYPLTGKHVGVTCASCHVKEPPPLTCYGCHAGLRSQPSMPNHLATGFPTDCTACHSTAGWLPSSFAHDQWFITSSGPHGKRGCGECHLDPADLTKFSCDGTCHKHTKTRMDSKHAGRSDYVYDFPACLKCHPGGKN